MASGFEGEDAGVGEKGVDFLGEQGEGEARGACAVVAYEERVFGGFGRGEVDVVASRGPVGELFL